MFSDSFTVRKTESNWTDQSDAKCAGIAFDRCNRLEPLALSPPRVTLKLLVEVRIS
jgi:hypothetical protein